MTADNHEKTPVGEDQKPTKWDKWGVIFNGLAAFGTVVAVPVSLFIGISSAHGQEEQAYAQAQQAVEQQQATSLDNYLQTMDTFLVNYHLTNSRPGSALLALAVAQTDTTIRSLDGVHKGILVRYLWETGLISEPKPVISLFETDLDGADFENANLWLANISPNSLIGSALSGAKLYGTDLADDNLSGADLSHANLSGADLIGTDLAGAILQGAEYNARPMQVTIAGKSINLRPTQWPKGFSPTSTGAVCDDC